MNLRTFSAAAFGLMLATSALLLTVQSEGTHAAGEPAPGTSTVQISWLPDWLADAVQRALVDATTHRERSSK